MGLKYIKFFPKNSLKLCLFNNWYAFFYFLYMLSLILNHADQWVAFPWKVRLSSLSRYPLRHTSTDGLLVWTAWEKCLCSSLAIEQLSRVLWFIQNLLFSDFWWAVHWEANTCLLYWSLYDTPTGQILGESGKNPSTPGKVIRKQEELATLG